MKAYEKDTFSVKIVHERVTGWTFGRPPRIELCGVPSYPHPGGDAAMEHGKWGITAFRTEAYSKHFKEEDWQSCSPSLTLLTI